MAKPSKDGDNEMMAASVDPQELVDLIELFLFDEAPSMTGPEVAAGAGIPFEQARERWRSLGFTSVPEDEVAFTAADLHALKQTEKLRALGIADEDTELALIRTIGRSFARLAEWQLDVLGRSIDLETTSVEELGALYAEVAPIVEDVSRYVWRRHTLSAASRALLRPDTDDTDGPALAVGFADIVGYTSQSRTLKTDQLAELIDGFEAKALETITEHGGRIIKTIGDEVLFVADTARDGALIALELAERHVEDEEFPELRVGVAYGPVLARLGDVFGPVVNIAARLTSTVRPGRVMVDRAMAEALETDGAFRVRRMRRTSVKGYRRLEPYLLRRPVGDDPEFDSDNLPGPASQFLAERGRNLVRAVEEGQGGVEAGADAEGSD
ncbi:MAG TPA: adenylate/guanylate cyclase domain-containing protein [Marmoricola sp.]